jgi:hypothetical protein
MEHKEFWRRYRAAKQQAVELAKAIIVESLPGIYMPFISFPMRQPSTDLALGERVFDRDDLFRKFGHTHPHPEREMVQYFWRNGFVPRWIEVNVFSTNGTITVLELHASDVFTRDEGDGGSCDVERPLKPWRAKGPPSPPNWRSVAESGRFSLNWHLQTEHPRAPRF